MQAARKMTPFEQAQQDVKAGKLKVPVVSGERGGKIPYFGYQLAVHKYKLSLMAIGMKGLRPTFTELKKYYGLKGRSPLAVLPQFIEIMETYKATA